MCPTQWFVPTRGIFQSWDRTRAQRAQERSGPPIPGPFVKQITSICDGSIFASSSAVLTNATIFCWWCHAVSFGKKPVPGGVMYVFLGFDRISYPSAEVYLTIPTPTLFALPSIPNAITFF
mmetsp:Transcript_20423/g.30904  ORF Transcript_20423/g.30904 Transcript_20423/m.30904 type:complete len:121 (+) Transcript_20423:465-827(+)